MIKIRQKFIKKRITENAKFKILAIYPIALLLLAVITTNPANIISGYQKILWSNDLLITDYFGVANLGATLFNAGLLGLLSLLLIKLEDTKLTGINIAALFTVMGFAMFGKNILNILPIILGVKLYAYYQKEPFNKFIIIALFSTALAPLVSQSAYIFGTSPSGILITILIGLVAGFITPPIATHLLSTHQGFNLYNLGFTAGLIGTLAMSLFRSYGIENEAQLIWTTKYTITMRSFLLLFFASLIFISYILNNNSFSRLKKLWTRSGRIATDFVIRDTFPVTLANMGLMGLIYLAILFIINSPLNGPTIGGLLTIVGFSAFGKHPFNTLPIVLGVLIGSFIKIWHVTDPGFILALLFSTTLAPITGVFGKLKGLIAGLLHLSIVMNVGYLHGGLNLYNNGLAGGLVAIILFPLLDALKKE